MISLRDALPEDAEAMASLEARAASHPWRANQYLESMQAGHLSLLLCREGLHCGQAIAMLVPDEAELLNIAIAPDCQGQGLGRHLLEAMLSRLRAQQIRRVFLEVRASNHIAQQLYTRCGFVECGLRKHYYPCAEGREHAILMEAAL
ncbi:ribosomal protein S18-alanine N-acetyltransferase [Paludibacterium sp. THUN1379]|uniref:ribosomal protein S18-alanine N-acetyltransferase n=1 Tax=Paludibacterium sp. THUN1379 TaxID=3112107 RepID=UPI00308619D2|nr:ribosomal protein S18-alanine N-acetyltransferase [Paludibacterium sp. THUN1379]